MDTDHQSGRRSNTLSCKKENNIEGDSSSPVPLCTLSNYSIKNSKVVFTPVIAGGLL